MLKTKGLSIRICISLLTCLLAIFSYTRVLDTRAEVLTERSFTRALVAFGIARSLNGVISVVQGTEFSIQPGGLGVVVTPGQLLDPINDLIERFSWVMLVASTSLGVQKVLLNIAAWKYLVLGITISLFLLAIQILRLSESRRAERAYRLVLLLLALRFGIAVIAIGGELIFTTFLQSEFENASVELRNTTTKLKQLQVVEEVEADSVQTLFRQHNTPATSGWKSLDIQSWVESLQTFFGGVLQNLDPTRRIEHYKMVAESASKSAIDLVVVFIFQTILFPVTFLFLLLHGIRSCLSKIAA